MKTSLGMKRIRTSRNEELDAALMLWFREMRVTRPHIPISPEVLQAQAELIRKEMEKEEDVHEEEEGADEKEAVPKKEVKESWIGRFCRRHGLKFSKTHGESGSSDEKAGDDWLKEDWASIIAAFPPEDIFNADECGLFWRRMPERTLTEKHDTVKGFKLSKERITILFCASMTGEKRTPVVIGTSTFPRSFNRLLTRPVAYMANENAWMTRDFFHKCLVDLNQQFKNEKRNVALIVDNCSAHTDHTHFSNIRLYFLPPNCTSTHQPLDQGIIADFKRKYRQTMIARRLLHPDQPITTCLDFAWCVTTI